MEQYTKDLKNKMQTPELIANEKKKQADAEAKIKAIEEQLSSLN